MTRSDIARLIKKSVRTVDRLIKSGNFPAPASIPGHPRWLESDILNWYNPRKDSVGFTVDRQDK